MGQLSRQQWITLILALSNSALVSLFPPYDYLSLERGNIPTFAGFYWLLGGHANHVINSDFLTLEIIVIMINAGIAWMLLANKPEASKKISALPAQCSLHGRHQPYGNAAFPSL